MSRDPNAARVWLLSDIEFAGGSRIARLDGPALVSLVEHLQPDDGTAPGGCTMRLAPAPRADLDWLDELELRQVVQVIDHFQLVREWRIASIDDGGGRSAGEPIEVQCESLIQDLLQVPIRETIAGGTTRFHLPTEASVLDLVRDYVVAPMQDAGYAWIALGLIESDQLLKPPIADWSPLQLLRWIQEQTALELHPGGFRRDPAGQVLRLDLLREVGQGAPAVYTRPGRNLIEMQRTRDREELRTAVIGRGATPDGATEPGTIGQTVLRIAAWDEGTRRATLEDPVTGEPPIAFADQFGGSAAADPYHVLFPDGRLAEVLDTIAESQQVALDIPDPPIALEGTLGANATKTVGTSLVVTLTAGAPRRDLGIIIAATDDASGVGADADTVQHTGTSAGANNVWTRRRERTNAGPSTSAGDGVTVSIHSCELHTALDAGAAVTLGSSNVPARTASVVRFRVPGGYRLDWANAISASASGTGTAPSVGVTLGDERHWLVLGAVGVEGPIDDGYTQAAGFADLAHHGTTGGTADTNISHRSGWRQGALASATFAPTLGTSRDWAAVIVAVPVALSTVPGTLAEMRADAEGTLAVELVNPPLIERFGGHPRGRMLGKVTLDAARPERNEVPNATGRVWPLLDGDPMDAQEGAFSFIGHRGNWSVTDATGEVVLPLSQAIPADRVVIVRVLVAKGSATPPTLSLTPSGGGAGIAMTLLVPAAVLETDAAFTVASYLARPTKPVSQLRVSHDGGARNTIAIAAQAQEWTASGSEIDVVDVATAAGSSDSPSVMLAGLDARDHLYLGAVIRRAAVAAGYTQDADFSDGPVFGYDGNIELAPVPGEVEATMSCVHGARVTVDSTGDTYAPGLAAAVPWAATLVALRSWSPGTDREPGTYVGRITALPGGTAVTIGDLLPEQNIHHGSRVRLPLNPDDIERTVDGTVTTDANGEVTLTLNAAPTGQSVDNRVRIDIQGDPPQGWVRTGAGVRVHRRTSGPSASDALVDGNHTSRILRLKALIPGSVAVQYGDRVIVGATSYQALRTVVADAAGRAAVPLDTGIGPAPSFLNDAPVLIESPTWPDDEPLGPYVLVLPGHGADDVAAPEFYVRYTAGLGPLWIAAGITYYGPLATNSTTGITPPRIRLLRATGTELIAHTDEARSLTAWQPLHVLLRAESPFTASADEDLRFRIRGTTNTTVGLQHVGLATFCRWVFAVQSEDPAVPPTEWGHANLLYRRVLDELRARRFPSRVALQLDDLAVRDGFLKSEERLTPGGLLVLDAAGDGGGERVRLIAVHQDGVRPAATQVEVDTRPRTLTRLLITGGR